MALFSGVRQSTGCRCLPGPWFEFLLFAGWFFLRALIEIPAASVGIVFIVATGLPPIKANLRGVQVHQSASIHRRHGVRPGQERRGFRKKV
jgi:hypothetical protein